MPTKSANSGRAKRGGKIKIWKLEGGNSVKFQEGVIRRESELKGLRKMEHNETNYNRRNTKGTWNYKTRKSEERFRNMVVE